jgi:hypothetical protein
VFYKNSLTDSSWLVAGTDVVAAGSSTSWVDSDTGGATHRFYVVMQVQ